MTPEFSIFLIALRAAHSLKGSWIVYAAHGRRPYRSLVHISFANIFLFVLLFFAANGLLPPVVITNVVFLIAFRAFFLPTLSYPSFDPLPTLLAPSNTFTQSLASSSAF
ncbi:hypothetical protein BC939DRAFT_459610 [Gamsiella multidivaricata]|uniref:uncharacterized protein n=1 Tax=Gamsiella multidivaricata TaxID=101098 RepID=UPI002220C1E8|nr:uncharacterized protein BC939DRAFT_459610 [Gamsiella multidivaricata]KAI7819730.1 hypothetical protein BC939DRAFT_459610 [Gamsiella multidivaricata]